MAFHVPEKYRVRNGYRGSDASYGNNGAFFIPNRAGRTRALSTREATSVPLTVIASDGVSVPDESADLAGWEHVSVSLPTRCPTWDEMCYVKSIFWDDEDTVMQLHPPKSQWVNNHPYCLHLWRPVAVEIPLPPSIMVGIKTLGQLL